MPATVLKGNIKLRLIMNYEETIELEESIKLKNEADRIWKNFKKNIKFEAKNYKGKGRFLHWQDSHNATYFELNEKDQWVYVCEFLHESYKCVVTPSHIFSYLKREYRGVDHLRSVVGD